MRIRTLVGILLALVAVVAASFLVQTNRDLLTQPMALGQTLTMPLSVAFVVVFLLGFVPPATVLLTQRLQQGLEARRERRRSREADSLQGAYRRALDFKADGQWRRAAEELETVLAGKPEDFAALLHYGEVLRSHGRAAEALEIHRRASVLYPQSVALLYEMAEDYAELGDEEVGREIRNRILRDFSGIGLEVHRRRRNEAMSREEWREAARRQDAIDATVLENEDREEFNRDEGIRLGLAYERALRRMEENQLVEAKKIFRELLAGEPRFVPASIMLGEASLLEELPDEAVAEWRRGYEGTGSPVFLQRIEDHFIERAEPARAIETLHRIMGVADNDLLPRFFLGRLYYRLEMLDEALRVLSGISDRVGTSPTYHLLLARIRERRGDLDQAANSYLTALQQAGLTTAEYSCQVCATRHDEWAARCEACGSWNALDLDFEEERLSNAELGVRERPVWTVIEDGDDEDPEAA